MKRKGYRVGVDPTFFPLELMGKEPSVLGFTNELLQEVSKVQRYRFQRINTAWDALLENLDKEKLDAIISPLYPYVFNVKKYDFSDLCLPSGPILVAPRDSTINGLDKINGAEVAVLDMTTADLLLEIAPKAIPRVGSNVAQILADLNKGKYNAAFLPSIPVQSYIADIYSDILRIVSKPQGREGLRFITLTGAEPDLVHSFNEGLRKLQRSGRYDALIKKWKL